MIKRDCKTTFLEAGKIPNLKKTRVEKLIKKMFQLSINKKEPQDWSSFLQRCTVYYFFALAAPAFGAAASSCFN